jgi:hypothetical protein
MPVPNDTNQIFATPCEFIDKNLPICSVIRPIFSENAGAKAAIAGFTAMGLFKGQSNAFFDFVMSLADKADEAGRDR